MDIKITKGKPANLEDCYEALMIFLMVADFNEEARRLYESIGYRQVGLLPDFYKKGINEHLLMKAKI